MLGVTYCSVAQGKNRIPEITAITFTWTGPLGFSHGKIWKLTISIHFSGTHWTSNMNANQSFPVNVSVKCGTQWPNGWFQFLTQYYVEPPCPCWSLVGENRLISHVVSCFLTLSPKSLFPSRYHYLIFQYMFSSYLWPLRATWYCVSLPIQQEYVLLWPHTNGVVTEEPQKTP